MRKIILIIVVSLIIFFSVTLAFLSIYGIKTNSFNHFINKKIQDYNPKLRIELDEVFIKLNLRQTSVKINSKNSTLIAEDNPVKISDFDINLNIIKFFRNENSIKNIKLQFSEQTIRDVTSFLNAINYNLTRYILYNQIKKGLINFEVEANFNSKNKNIFSYNIFGEVKDAKLKLIGFSSFDKINFKFNIKDNKYEITNLKSNYQNLKIASKFIEIIKKKDNSYDIKGDIDNYQTEINPKILFKLANLKNNFFADKNIGFQSKNLFSFNLNSNYQIKNLNIESIIDFDEIYFNDEYQSIIFLKNGKIKSKYEKNKFSADLLSKFSFVDEENLANEYEYNDIELNLLKEIDKNINIVGTISNQKKLINPRLILNLFKIDPNLVDDEKINIKTDSKFQFEIDKNNQLKSYSVNSNINFDKLIPNEEFKSFLFLTNVKTDLIVKNGLLNIDLKSNYSFSNKKYNNPNYKNIFNLKLDKFAENNSEVEIFLNTNNNKINTKELNKLFNLNNQFVDDQIIELNSNFLINFSLNKNNKIENLNLKSDINLDSLQVKYYSKDIQRYIDNYKNILIFKKPKILIDYKDNVFDLQLDGKYSFKNKYDNIFINLKGKKNNFDFYTSLNLNQSILKFDEIDYSKKENVPSNFEILLNSKNNKVIINKIKYLENENKIFLNNLYLADDHKILKIDKIDLNFINKNKILNNLKITRKSDNYLVSGKIYDVQQILETLLKNNNTKKISKFFKNINSSLVFDIDQLYLEKDFYLNKFSGEIDIKNNKLFLAKLNAILNETNKFSYSFRTTPKNEKITNIFIEKPKPFINNFKFIKGFDGGELNLNSTKIQNTSRSNLRITNFKVKEVPVLAKILTLASLQGIADLLTGEGIRFDKFEMDYKTKNNLTEIEEMYALGPSISIMMRGYIEKDKLTSLKGTLVPATTINKTIAKIPVIGDILVGNKTGEGIFGVSFKIKGSHNDLKSTVNPIKTLTPRFITRTLENLKGD